MRRLTHAIVLAAFIFSCGGQWYALQCVAWIDMLHDYAQVVSFPQAVSMTFSGQYPCAICKALAEKKNAEQQKCFAFQKYDKKFFTPVAIAIAPPMESAFPYRDDVTLLRSRTETPPTPPPRALLS